MCLFTLWNCTTTFFLMWDKISRCHLCQVWLLLSLCGLRPIAAIWLEQLKCYELQSSAHVSCLICSALMRGPPKKADALDPYHYPKLGNDGTKDLLCSRARTIWIEHKVEFLLYFCMASYPRPNNICICANKLKFHIQCSQY